MTFFDKKQEVIDVQLTRFGKNLLSRGAFKPVYYQFFDDDVIYSLSRIGTSEHQNESEPRIEDSARLRTQHTTVGLETSFDAQQKLIESGKRGVFLKMRRQMDPLEKDKLLKYPLANYKIGSEDAPCFVLKSLGSNITGSLVYLHPSASGIYKNRPTINIKPKYEIVVDKRNTKEPENVVIDSESFIDLTTPRVEFLDGSTITTKKTDFIIDLQELATTYGLDNFEVEIYEETEKGSENYVRMIEEAKILALMNIKTDESVKEIKVDIDKSRNFYSE